MSASAMIPFVLSILMATATIPDGSCVLINGLVGEDEWERSASILLDAETELRVHKDPERLFLGVLFKGPRHTGIDLYLKAEGGTRMLHVSSALGDRMMQHGEWSEIVWGRNSWWTANPIGSIVEEGKQRFLEPQAFEFQIDRAALGDSVRVFIHLKRPEKRLPPEASEDREDGWLLLDLR
jgi:hypothetical protein